MQGARMSCFDNDDDPSSSLDPTEAQAKPLSRSAVNYESRGYAGDGHGRRSAADDDAAPPSAATIAAKTAAAVAP